MATLREQLYDYERFLADIGRCITGWANVEEKLFDICALAVKAPRKQAAIVYFRTPTIETRMHLVEELLLALFPPNKPGKHSPPEIVKWAAIRKSFTKLLPERNAMAHFPLRSHFPESRETYFLRPQRDETLRGRKLAIERLNADRLPKHLEGLRELESKLMELRSLLHQKLHK